MKYAVLNPDSTAIIEFRFYDPAPPPGSVLDSTTEDHLWPVAVIRPPYDPISYAEDGPLYTINVPMKIVEERWTVRAKTQAEIDAMRTDKISQVHHYADIYLETQVTLHRQMHAICRIFDILFRHTNITTWPQAQQDTIAEMLARLATTANVHQEEDAKVAELNALTTAAQIAAYDPTAGWTP